MLVIIKSSPITTEGKRGIKIAQDTSANICLIQDAVYFAQKGRLEGYYGTVFVLNEDARMRGLSEKDMSKDIKEINYEELIDVMIREEKVIGAF